MGSVVEASAGDLVAREQELAQSALAGIDKKDLILPVVKITQQLSREVTAGDVESGHFINSLTGEDYGAEIELVIAHCFKGRFYAPKGEDRVYVASGDVAPANWPEQYAGQAFADIPDAEEQHKIKANADGGEWGSGPLIQTTHNYIGFTVDEPGLPVRLSLKGTSTPAARKINSLLTFGGSPWASTIRLATEQRENRAKQPYFIVTVKQGEQTDQAAREAALSLAQTATAAQFSFTGDEPDENRAAAKASAKKGGGLDV